MLKISARTVCAGVILSFIGTNALIFNTPKLVFAQDTAELCNYYYQQAHDAARNGEAYVVLSSMMNYYCVQVLTSDGYVLAGYEVLLEDKDYNFLTLTVQF